MQQLVGMAMQRVADRCPVALQVDMRNAFNSIDRTHMLSMALQKAPSVYNWLSWCYQAATPLYCQGRVLPRSTAGVHQGDAMGPIGFALGLEHALDQCLSLEDACPWVTWYLDDGLVVGELEQVMAYLEALQPALQRVGLHLNLSKCSLWGPGVMSADDMADLIPDSVAPEHPIRQVPIVPYGGREGITLLGVPCDAPGHNVQADMVWGQAVEGTLAVLDRL